MMNDRRSIGRTKIGKDAFLFFGAQTGLRRCTVTNTTNAGAGIRTQGLAAIYGEPPCNDGPPVSGLSNMAKLLTMSPAMLPTP
jgi:hypothetical protein